MSTENGELQLLRAEDLARMLKKPQKTVYDLPIPQVRLGPRTVRWKHDDVIDFIENRRDDFAAN